jgi:hypothetical protein
VQALAQLGREHQMLAERGLQACLHREWSAVSGGTRGSRPF